KSQNTQQQMILQFNQLYKTFIRPSRQEYTIFDLGPDQQIFGNQKTKRTDIQIINMKNQQLQCSLFQPFQKQNPEELLELYDCVIYCHCNSGSRLEALPILPYLIQKGLGLFCFDFSGSGISEGDYVTLGVYLWGRSMGAATIILYSRDSQSRH
ncbi:hypothetical protein IMG5_157330, partial [Ichthyophthirius multifiliis]